MKTPETDRRTLLATGGAVLLAGLAGCSAFDDTEGTPDQSEPPNDDNYGGDRPHSDPFGDANSEDEGEDGEDGSADNSTSEDA